MDSKSMLERVAREEDKLRTKLARQLYEAICRLDASDLAVNSKLVTVISTHCNNADDECCPTGMIRGSVDVVNDDHGTPMKAVNTKSANTDFSSQAVSDLGSDLLSLYQCSIETDLTISVGDRSFLVHRSILAARSDYFSAMLCGGWQESVRGTFTLQGVSPTAFQHLLHFLYGGMLTFEPTEVDLRDLVTITDMFMLSGFQEMVTFLMKKHFCHFFHKPCGVCSVGVLQVLTVTCHYQSFTSIYRSALDWVVKNFTRIWVTERFAKLPNELLAECGDHVISNMGVATVLSTVMDVNYMLEKLSPRHSFHSVSSVLVHVREACVKYLASHFVGVVNHRSFFELSKGRSWGLVTVETILTEALNIHPADGLCSSYVNLCSVADHVTTAGMMVGMEFVAMVRSLIKSCKQQIAVHVNQIIDSDGWVHLPPDVQKEISDQAYFVKFGSGAVRKKPQLFSQKRKVEKPKSLNPPKPVANKQLLSAASKKCSNFKTCRKESEHEAAPRKQNRDSDCQKAQRGNYVWADLNTQDVEDEQTELFADNEEPFVRSAIELPVGEVFNVYFMKPELNFRFHVPQ